MADLKEVRIDNVTISLIAVGTRKTMMTSGQTFADDGTLLRTYGPQDVYATLSPAQLAQFDSMVAQAIDLIQAEFGISDADLLPPGGDPS